MCMDWVRFGAAVRYRTTYLRDFGMIGVYIEGAFNS